MSPAFSIVVATLACHLSRPVGEKGSTSNLLLPYGPTRERSDVVDVIKRGEVVCEGGGEDAVSLDDGMP